MSRRLPYADYLQSEHWRTTRKQALERAGHRCQCGMCPLASLYPHEIAENFPRSVSRLEVHHLTYERLGAEAPEDLLVLCGLCHRVVHGVAGAVDAFEDPGPIPLREVIARLGPFQEA
jgi:predicted HNH restriction endonuclease